MEIKIVITKKNKEKVLKLIDQLVECEAEGMIMEPSTKTNLKAPEAYQPENFLKELSTFENIKFAEPEINQKKFGAWGMFNSYAPGKAALRVLMNMLDKNAGNPIKFAHLIDECMTYFSRSGLYKYRGFPKSISESARGRLATHLILPYHDMGLMRVHGGMKNGHVVFTEKGLAFAKLQNPLLDEKGKTKPLSEEESQWLISYLQEIDGLGYKEFSLFKGLTEFLAGSERQFEDIVDWFKNKKDFVEWLREGSRYEDDPKAFSRQLDNVATTYASGKIALLRELGILSTSRATYKVLSGLEESSQNGEGKTQRK
jgi:hypothetical protein